MLRGPGDLSGKFQPTRPVLHVGDDLGHCSGAWEPSGPIPVVLREHVMLGFRSALAVCKACSLEPCSIYFFAFLWSEIGSHLQVFRDYPSETWGTI